MRFLSRLLIASTLGPLAACGHAGPVKPALPAIQAQPKTGWHAVATRDAFARAGATAVPWSPSRSADDEM